MKIKGLSRKRKPEKLKVSDVIAWIFLSASAFLLFYWMLKMSLIEF